MAQERVNIIIVNDDQDTRELLGDWLTFEGYSVRLAATAGQALALAEDDPPVCMLLDLGLPDFDGSVLADMLRRRYGQDLVLIAITGRDSDEAKALADKVGIDLVLTKPVGTEDLQRLLPPLRP
jgi:DNA-binding response OmpR family regulator